MCCDKLLTFYFDLIFLSVIPVIYAKWQNCQNWLDHFPLKDFEFWLQNFWQEKPIIVFLQNSLDVASTSTKKSWSNVRKTKQKFHGSKDFFRNEFGGKRVLAFRSPWIFSARLKKVCKKCEHANFSSISNVRSGRKCCSSQKSILTRDASISKKS